MQIEPFKLERYFAEYEFKVRYLLSASDCERLTMEELLALADEEVLGLWRTLTLGYTESQGHPLLRQEIAKLYQRNSADGVLVAAPEEAIFIAMNVLLAPGDHLIITSPAYQSLYTVARSRGCEVSRWPVELEGEHWRLRTDVLERSIKAQTKLLVVNFPHNPTGFLPSQELFRWIVEVARQRGLYLFSDEMYRLLEQDAADRLPSACDLYEKGLTLSGLSKSFALPGLRIGWLATRDHDLLARCAGFKDYTTICSSAPSEVLGIIALRAREAILARSLGIVEDNVAAAGQFFARHSEWFTWLPPQAGSVAFPQLNSALPVAQFCRDLLDSKSVMAVPANVFDYEGNHFRVGLGRKNLPTALRKLQEYLEEAGFASTRQAARVG